MSLNTKKKRQCRGNGTSLTESGNTRSKQLLMMQSHRADNGLRMAARRALEYGSKCLKAWLVL